MNQEIRQPIWQETLADGRLWRSADPCTSIQSDLQHGKPDRFPTIGRARSWDEAEALEVSVDLGEQTHAMKHIGDSHVWEANLPTPSEGSHVLKVFFKDAHGKSTSDEILLAIGQRMERQSEKRGHDDALEAWPEHVLLGTQLGPNKNGKNW